MEGSFLSPPAKRPHQKTNQETASKRRSRTQPLSIPPNHASLRLLCHITKIGGVIGKSGSVIKTFRQQTDAKIRIEEIVTECEERVIVIIAADSPKKKITVKGLDGEKGQVFELSPLQETFIRIFERILDVEAEIEGIFPPPGGAVSCRLLAAATQVGAVMGKGGKNIEMIRGDSGAKIRVLPTDQAPLCAAPAEEVISVMGDVSAVKKALVAITGYLQDNPPTYPDIYEHPPRRTTLDTTVEYGSGMDYGIREVDKYSAMDSREEEVVFRLLCSNDTVGGVIGRGGNIVRSLQEETGATISVGPALPEADERVVTVSAKEKPESRYSPAQNALLRVFTRSVEASIEKGLDAGSNKSGSVSARLLVSTKEVGCLMGKGGAIIQEMRKATGTSIRILGNDKVPKCASEGDQMVQIVGDFRSVEDAVYNVTVRLRDNIFPNKTLNGPGPGSYSFSTAPDVDPYARLREPISPVQYPSFGLPRNTDRQNTYTQGMDHLGFSHSLDRPRSPPLWPPQTLSGGNSRGIADGGRGLTSFRGGLDYGSGAKSAIVTNTTVEILVPEQVLGSVYGDSGSNLHRLRQISGAKVVLHEPRPGTSDAIVIISGTPDQTQAAQSLLQAFILSGQSSPDHRSRLL